MIRRSPEAIVAAHRMDPERRELYVEGRRDRLFLEWLTQASIDSNASIREIATVELPAVEAGGERGRLLEFARQVAPHECNIAILADADLDPVLERDLPEGVWLTDQRDLEGYVLNETCLRRVLTLGVGTELVEPAEVLASIEVLGRRLGNLRLLSEVEGRALPFRATGVWRYLRFSGHELRLNLDGYVAALLQNAGISLAERPQILDGVARIEAEYVHVDGQDLIHGRDAFEIAGKHLVKAGAHRDAVASLLWTSFDTSLIAEGSTLEAVCDFLSL